MKLNVNGDLLHHIVIKIKLHAYTKLLTEAGDFTIVWSLKKKDDV